MHGRKWVESAFSNTKLSQLYKITRTRDDFPDYTADQDGEDSFALRAQRGLEIIDRVVKEEMIGRVDTKKGVWSIAQTGVETATF